MKEVFIYILALYSIVVTIQKANKSRKMSYKNRMLLLRYYWENIKVDMSKVLLSDKNDTEAAKQISCRVFAIKEEVSVEFLRNYIEFCRLVFIVKFILWRT